MLYFLSHSVLTDLLIFLNFVLIYGGEKSCVASQPFVNPVGDTHSRSGSVWTPGLAIRRPRTQSPALESRLACVICSVTHCWLFCLQLDIMFERRLWEPWVPLLIQLSAKHCNRPPRKFLAPGDVLGWPESAGSRVDGLLCCVRHLTGGLFQFVNFAFGFIPSSHVFVDRD